MDQWLKDLKEGEHKEGRSLVEYATCTYLEQGPTSLVAMMQVFDVIV